MPFEQANWLLSCLVPQSEGVVFAAREQSAAVGVEGDVADASGVAFILLLDLELPGFKLGVGVEVDHMGELVLGPDSEEVALAGEVLHRLDMVDDVGGKFGGQSHRIVLHNHFVRLDVQSVDHTFNSG